MAKEKRPTWFKVYLNIKSTFDAAPDEEVGKAVKQALNYFDTGEIVEMSQITYMLFSTLKYGIDEALSDFKRSVESGSKGGKAKAINAKQRKEDDSTPIAPLSPPIVPLTDSLGVSTERKIEDYKGYNGFNDKNDKNVLNVYNGAKLDSQPSFIHDNFKEKRTFKSSYSPQPSVSGMDDLMREIEARRQKGEKNGI